MSDRLSAPPTTLPLAEAGPDSVNAINQRLFETSLDLILVVDKSGNFIRVSPSARAILGRDPDSMVGQSAVGYIHPDDLDSTREEMRAARRGRQMRNFQCRYMHRNGKVVDLSWTGVWSEETELHFFIGRDVTESRATEEKLRHLQRMDSIGQLTGGIAHDFNNILAIVVGSLDMLAGQPELNAESRKFVADALHAAGSGAELTRRLLAFARQQPLMPRVIDVNAQIQQFAPLLRRSLGQHIEVNFLPGANVWPVFIDAANLEAAITNLAVNARDAMPQGGRLILQTENATLDQAYVDANPGAEPGDYVSVMISDTGTGMAADVADRIFEPFFTTKAVGQGSGLGLSMVFGFLKQSGGHIKVYSEPGHGTTMRLYLPRAGAGALSANPSGGTGQAQPGQRQSRLILVVEDNEDIRAVVLQQLAKLGYRTIAATNAGEAMRYIDSGAPLDLLFTDIVMPGGMSGYDLAREARRARPDMRILFTSGFPGAVFPDTLEHDPKTMLSKPYRMQELASRLAEIFGEGRPEG